MRLFARTPQHPHIAAADEWRGRSRDLPDVAGLPWQAVMAALETDGPAAVGASGEIFAALGLERGEIPPRWAESPGGVRLGGVRYGRQAEIRIGLREHNWGSAAAMVTWLRAATPDPHLDGGRTGAIHPRLAADPAIWGGVRVRGGAEGLVAFRKLSTRAHSQGFLYDLWLLERIADLQEASALPVRDLTGIDVPYGLG